MTTGFLMVSFWVSYESSVCTTEIDHPRVQFPNASPLASGVFVEGISEPKIHVAAKRDLIKWRPHCLLTPCLMIKRKTIFLQGMGGTISAWRGVLIQVCVTLLLTRPSCGTKLKEIDMSRNKLRQKAFAIRDVPRIVAVCLATSKSPFPRH